MQPWKIRLRTYLTGTWHYRWIGMGVAWAVCIIGWLGVALVPNQFQAVSMIYVDTDTMMAPLLKDLTVTTDPQQQVSVMLNTLLARPNLEQVVHLTNPKASSLSSAEMAKQVQTLQDNISIKPLSTKNLFQLSFTDRDPDKGSLRVDSSIACLGRAGMGWWPPRTWGQAYRGAADSVTRAIRVRTLFVAMPDGSAPCTGDTDESGRAEEGLDDGFRVDLRFDE